MKNPTRICWLAPFFVFLAACAPIIRSEQTDRPAYEPLGQSQTVGQSFFSRYAGLAAIEVYLESGSHEPGDLFFHLKQSAKSQQDLRTVNEGQAGAKKPGFERFEFPPLADSSLKSYYFYLHSNKDGAFRVGSGDGDSYLNGSQYLNDLAIDAQSTFRLIYDPFQLLIGLLIEGFNWLGYVLAAGLIYILPGWAILSWTLPDWDSSGWEVKFTWSIGVGLAIYPLLFLWTDVVGIHFGPVYAWLPIIFALGGILLRNRSTLRQLFVSMRNGSQPFLDLIHPRVFHLVSILLIIIAVEILIVRFWPIRALPAPMWGDSYQHTLISQLLVDNKGLFSNWQPYADLITFTYHFGFHSLVAVFHWITRLSLPQATLWVGQIINVMAVLALYPLAIRVGRSPWVGVLAVLLAGILSPMPMFYTNWGRYTQLTGQAILPAAVLIAWDILDSPAKNWRRYLPAWLVFAGLALTHYRILIFAAFFIIAYWILRLSRSRVLELAKSTAILAGGAAVLFLPWLIRVFAGKIPLILRAQITTPASQVSAFTEQYNSIGNLFTYLPAYFWLLLPIALAWGFWRRERDFTLICLWWFLVFLAANPQWFQLPGSGVLSNFAVLIAAYIPVSLLLASAGFWAVVAISSHRENHHQQPSDVPANRKVFFRWVPLILLIFIAGAGLWGARQRLRDIQPAQFSLVTWPDMQAAAWIQENIPPGARFLVNSFFAYGGDVIVGSDAGWWMPLLTGRSTTLPPVNYGSEVGTQPDYRKWINQLTAEIDAKGVADPGVLQLLEERGVTHVYIGQLQGQVNNSGTILEPEQLLKSPYFHPVYHQNRIWIFEIEYPEP